MRFAVDDEEKMCDWSEELNDTHEAVLRQHHKALTC